MIVAGGFKMKKVLSVILSLGIAFTIFGGFEKVKGNDENLNSNVQKSIEKKLIRFHVIANSDTAEDQALKLKVRDKVLQYIYPKLKNSKSIDESRNILKENDEAIRKLAQDVVKKNGYSYTVTTELSFEKFPIKTYGNITLPQGEYEAYRILIGTSKGQNWWCVMFPPLCFVDITKGEVSYKETEKTMKQVLSKEEYEAVDNTNINKDEESNKIQVKFKFIEEIKKLMNKTNKSQ